MTDHTIRYFADDAAVRHVGEGLLARSLPKDEWTHEAHLAVCLWLLIERGDILPERDLPQIIRAYNIACGAVNDDTQGYHETLTQLYIRGVRGYLTGAPAGGLAARVNALLASEIAPRDWPLRYYSREVLFCVAARQCWVEPDRLAI